MPASPSHDEHRSVDLQDQGAGSDQFGQPASALRGEGTLTAHPGGILITTHLWFTWLQVAVERAKEARRVRTEMDRMQAAGKNISSLISSEFEAAVVAIAASAHALDALYGSSVIPPSARNKGENRPAKIREALKAIFNTGPRNTPWVGKFKWLFGLRDAAVHAEEKPKPPDPHPVAGHTSQENASYTVEVAEEAVTFVLSVFRWCVDHPRPESQKWANDQAPMVKQLEDNWPGPV